MKKLISLVLALAMVLMVGAALATDPTPEGKITVTPPDNTTSDSENTYVLYKVFDAITDGSAYTYSLTGDHTSVPSGFILDDAGNIYFAEEVAAGTEGAFTVKVGGVNKTIKKQILPQSLHTLRMLIRSTKRRLPEQMLLSLPDWQMVTIM